MISIEDLIPFDQVKKEHKSEIFTKYHVVVETANRLLGGWPKDPKMEYEMLKARFRAGDISEDVLLAAQKQEVEKSSDDPDEEKEKAVDKAATGFKFDDQGIYLESRQFKAGIKECCSALNFTSNKQTSEEIKHGLFVMSRDEDKDKIRLHNGDILKEPQGYEQLIAHVDTARGPRSTIKFHDFVEPGTQFEFEIWFIQPKKTQVTEGLLVDVLHLAEYNGFGCSRSQGFGRVKILGWKCLGTGKIRQVLNKKEIAEFERVQKAAKKTEERKKKKAEEDKAKKAGSGE